MKKLLLSIGLIFAAQSILSAEKEISQTQIASNLTIQAESISAGPLSEKNEKFIRDCMAEWKIENPTIQFRKPTQEIIDIYPFYNFHHYVKDYNYWYINESFFDSLTDGEKKVLLSKYFFVFSSSLNKITKAKPWIYAGIWSVLSSLMYLNLQGKNTIYGYELTTFKRWATILLGADIGTHLLVDLPFYIYKKIATKNENFAIDQKRAEKLNDYQSAISYLKKLQKAIESLLVGDKAWQEAYDQLPGRIENLEKLAAQKA